MEHNMSLQDTDQAGAAVAVAPRVSLADIEGAIAQRYHFTASEALPSAGGLPELDILSMCVLVMRNGFMVVGKSAPASRENFNADLGKKFAYEDCIRQLWPLMGFLLRDRLAAAAPPAP
jgi:hypothetical protein